jgi:hypothetical protein
LKGARWLDSKSPGLYQMSDIYSSWKEVNMI